MQVWKIAAVIGTVLSAPAAWAQTLALEFAPTAGTIWKVSQTRSQLKAKFGDEPVDGSIEATLEVLEETDDGYVMQWTIDVAHFGGFAVRDQPELLIGVPIRFDTDWDGFPVRIHDADAIINTTINTMDADPEGKARVRALFGRLAPADFAYMFVKDAAIIAGCHNFELDRGAPIEGEVEIASPVDGSSIRAVAKISLEDEGSPDRPARILMSSSLDPESAAASLYGIAKELSGEDGAESLLQDGQLPTLTHNTNVECQVDVATGAARFVRSDEDVNVNGVRSRDTRTITMTPR